MSESKVRASMNDIFEVLEQQKKLEKINALIKSSLEKVNQTINAITVENLTLTRSELDEELNEPQQNQQHEEVLPKFEIKNSHEVNSQILDIDIKPACFNEEIESDEELEEF